MLRIKRYFITPMEFIIVIFFLLSCKKDEPTEPDVPKGVFVDKVTFMTWGQSVGYPKITTADLYYNRGIFRLYNRRELIEGSFPILSSDRSWIAYILNRNGLYPMRINVDGTQMQAIPFSNNLAVQTLSISPDGAMLALEFHDINGFSGGIHIGVMSSTGENLRTVYADSGWSSSPTWSHDGKKLYFKWLDYKNRFRPRIPGNPRANSYIVSVNLDGTNWQAISDTLLETSHVTDPVVSPDGKQLAYTSQQSYPDRIVPEIFVMNIDGNNVQRLTFAIDGGTRHGDHYDHYTQDAAPRWTKDGQYIILERQTYVYDHAASQYQRTLDLYIIKSDGTGMQKLTNDGESGLLKR